MTDKASVPAWRHIVAFILDLIFSFAIFGYIVAKFTGNTTEGGFSLNGAPALIVFGLVILYFIGMSRKMGGTVFQRLLRTR
jgi:hypothetical protein